MNEHESASLTKAIVGLASALRLTTVAEGIEQQDQAGSLSEFGVGLGQGYLFARPMTAMDLRAEFLQMPAVTTEDGRRLKVS